MLQYKYKWWAIPQENVELSNSTHFCSKSYKKKIFHYQYCKEQRLHGRKSTSFALPAWIRRKSWIQLSSNKNHSEFSLFLEYLTLKRINLTRQHVVQKIMLLCFYEIIKIIWRVVASILNFNQRYNSEGVGSTDRGGQLQCPWHSAHLSSTYYRVL